MDSGFRYVNALRNIQQSYNQFYVFGLFATDDDVEFPPNIVNLFKWYSTTDLYLVDTQDNCLHIRPKQDGNRFWIKGADLGRIRRMYRRSSLLSVELRYVGWGVFYMFVWDINRKDEPPCVVDELYAAKVLPDYIVQRLASVCGAYFNKEAQLRVYQTEMFLRNHRRIQQQQYFDTQQSGVNKRQHGEGAEAGPSKRQRPQTSPESSVNQGSN